MKKYIIWFLIVSLIVVVAFPLALDKYILGNSFPSNVTNSDWVGFFGGYSGAILGGFISLIGIVFTIRFTREQNRADRELQIKPYLDIRFRWTEKSLRTNDWLGYVNISIEDSDNSSDEMHNTGSGLLYLRNVGSGPATDVACQLQVFNLTCKHHEQYYTQNTKVTTSSIRPNEEASISVDVFNSRVAPPKEEITWETTASNTPIPFWDRVKYHDPAAFSIALFITYRDLLSNQFKQQIDLKASYYSSADPDKGAKYQCELSLVEVHPSQRI